MTSPQANPFWKNSGAVNHPVRFRFRVTWSTLSTPLNNAWSQNTLPAKTPVAFTTPAFAPAVDPPPLASISLPALSRVREAPVAPSSTAQWEMVVPKMVRPPAKPATAPPPAPPARAEAPVKSESTPSLYTTPERFLSLLRWKLLLIGAALSGLVLWLWLRSPVSPSDAQIQSTVRASTWSRRDAYTAGSKRGRQIVLYDGSRDESDYRVEFAWVPDSKGVGLAFRVRDSGNYSAARLSVLQSGRTPTLSVERFTVSAGLESRHSQRVITLPGNDSAVNVRMDASGPSFSLYVNGQPVDLWTDQRFLTGGIGFYDERKDQATVRSLRYTFFKKGAVQAVVTAVK